MKKQENLLKKINKAEEMLQNTEKLSITGQLAAGIAHEIRNPITAIKGFIQLMHFGSDSYKEYFNIMSSEIKRIEQILSELLILAKPHVSKFERKDVNVLFAQVVTLLETQAILNNIRFMDEGVGMSKETLSKLGQPFYTTKETGTGLGFMISKKIIENHFGEVTIMSELNEGTTIEVILPLNL